MVVSKKWWWCRKRVLDVENGAGVAKTVGSERGAVAEDARQQTAGAGIVPGYFGNVGQRRAIGGSVGRIPIASVGSHVRVGEVGASHRNIVGRGSERTHADAVRRGGHSGVATGRALIARGDKNRNAFRHRLLKHRAESRIRRGARRDQSA